MTRPPVTPGQKKQIVCFAESALDKVTMTSEEWQRVLAQGDELQKAIIDSVVELGKGKFPDEEVESDYVYPSGYSPKDITAQTNILQELFPGLGYAKEELAKASLPKGAEAFFAILRWQKLGETYEEAVEKVLGAIASKRAFRNHAGELGPDYLRRSERTERMLQTLAQQQGNPDILIVPAQFGLRHRGRSVRRVREMFTAQEFGLGVFEAGIMLLTHPERLTDYKDLWWVDCPGDEYSPDAGGQFGGASCFGLDFGEVRFHSDWTGHADDYCGSVSAFLPQ